MAKKIRILPLVPNNKLADECKVCKRLVRNNGTCGGRESRLNICLAFKAG